MGVCPVERTSYYRDRNLMKDLTVSTNCCGVLAEWKSMPVHLKLPAETSHDPAMALSVGFLLLRLP